MRICELRFKKAKEKFLAVNNRLDVVVDVVNKVAPPTMSDLPSLSSRG